MTSQPSPRHRPHDELPQPYCAAVETILCEPIPEIDLKSLLPRQSAAIAPPLAGRPYFWARISGWSLAAAAVLLILALGWVTQRPKGAWAEVVDALKTMPWIHMKCSKTIDPESKEQEAWYSASRQVRAERGYDPIIYEDLRAGIRYEFNSKTATLTRSPLDSAESADGLRFFYALILQRDLAVGTQFGDCRVLASTSRSKKNGTMVSQEFEVTFLLVRDPDQISMTAIVHLDPGHKLPTSMELFPTLERAVTTRVDIDYPETGPVDIYSLGVPRDAKMVDRP